MPNDSLNTHAPDQTDMRPQLLHCAIDLTAVGHRHLISNPILWGFAGRTP
jgi:hypothetical protein